MRFAVFTHVEHIKREGMYYAYAPYVREMNIWLGHVDEVEVVGARRQGDWWTGGLGDREMRRKRDLGTRGLGNNEPGRKGDLDTEEVRENEIPYEHSKLTFTEVPAFNFLNFLSAVKAIIKIPYIFLKIFGTMRRADHLHLRCPGNIGLLACLAQIFFPSKPKSAKYAGNWDPQAKQPWTYRFQKWVLSNTFLTRNIQVLVYGEWPAQSENIVPFFTASFSEEEKVEVRKKTFSEPFIFLFVGNLVVGKQPLEAIKLVQELIDKKSDAGRKIYARLEIFGNGPEREKLEKYVAGNRLEDGVIFKGNRPLAELKEAYQKAHFVILPSRSEGWPKALAEGMFFGCIPIATPVSCVPWMLGDGSRGILISHDNPNWSRVDSGERTVESKNQEPRTKTQDGQKEWSVSSGQWSEGKQSQQPMANSQQLKISGQRVENRGQDLLKNLSLLADQEEMKQMSEEAKKWSKQYTLEVFEEAIKEVLNNKK